jgi:hypothetical protein
VKGGVVVDTSVFVRFFRGEPEEILPILIADNRVLLSPVVRLELLAGVRKQEFRTVENLLCGLRIIDTFPTPLEVERMLNKAKGCGLLGGIADLIILSDALRHGSALYTIDDKLKKLAKRLAVELL